MSTTENILNEERQGLIRTQLASDGRVVAAELAGRFGVSEATIRRDLRELAQAGLCRKVYGGAIAGAPYGGRISQRAALSGPAKASLAVAAVRLIAPGQTVFIDAGSTNIAIASALPPDLEITVVTNAPGVAAALSDHSSARLIVLGGVYHRETGACSGATTLTGIAEINADLFMLGACGVHATVGTTAFDPAEAEVKRAMAQNSASLIVAATTDKLGTAASFRLTAPDAITHLIVEKDAPEEMLASFEALGSAVHRAS